MLWGSQGDGDLATRPGQDFQPGAQGGGRRQSPGDPGGAPGCLQLPWTGPGERGALVQGSLLCPSLLTHSRRDRLTMEALGGATAFLGEAQSCQSQQSSCSLTLGLATAAGAPRGHCPEDTPRAWKPSPLSIPGPPPAALAHPVGQKAQELLHWGPGVASPDIQLVAQVCFHHMFITEVLLEGSWLDPRSEGTGRRNPRHGVLWGSTVLLPSAPTSQLDPQRMGVPSLS